MSGGARRSGRGRRPAKPGVAAFRSPLTALIVALSLVFQLVAIPYHQALIASAAAAPDAAQVAAELKATFGDAAALCVQSEDQGGPAAPAGDCDDHCPLCQFAAQAAALIATDAPAIQVRLGTSFRTLAPRQRSARSRSLRPSKTARALRLSSSETDLRAAAPARGARGGVPSDSKAQIHVTPH